MNYFWYVWCKAMGEKAHNSSKISNHVALIRTAIVMVYVITNIAIIANIVHNW